MKRAVLALLAVAVLLAAVIVVNRDAPVNVQQVTVEGDVALDAAWYAREGLTAPAAALLLAHGFGGDRLSMDAVAREWARRGYVVMTWSARGFGESEGVIGLNDPSAEIVDVSVLIDWLSDLDMVALDAPDDPVVGIAGGSYGGATALLAGAADPRLDAVVAASTWHNLPATLAPNAGAGAGVLKSQWASLLFTSGTLGGFGGFGAPPATQSSPSQVDANDAVCGRFSLALCRAYEAAVANGLLNAGDAELLGRADMAGPLSSMTVPTLLLHGLDDTLFGLGQSLDNATAIRGAGAPVSLRWVAGAHGGIGGPDWAGWRPTVEWFDRWLPANGSGPDAGRPDGEVFGWVDAASGETRLAPVLPEQVGAPAAEEAAMTFVAAGGALIDPGAASDGTGPVLLTHPPGGIPAALSTLPGLGSAEGLLGGADVPGQHVTFDTAALATDSTLLGRPVVTLDVGVLQGPSTPPPVVLVKLLDVSPGGAARLLHSTVTPVRLRPDGEAIRAVLPPVAHRVVAGNRLRLVLATTDQGFASGTDPAVLAVPTDGSISLMLPVDRATIGTTLPVLVRVALPMALVVLLVIGATVALGRHERRLAAEPPATEDGPVVAIRGLVKAYADGKVAVDGLDLEVARGQVFGLLGPNGAGKTTTMRMLLGLIAPTEGEISLLGHPVRPGHPVFRRVGVLVEGPGFAPYLTGRQNLTSYWLAGGEPLEAANMARALDVADLGAALDRPVRTYSHGMRQRLAIAQALLGDPELLVLDEPTDGLDPEQIRGMRQLLARLGAAGTTILVSSHLLAEVEQMCTHVAVVQHGRVVVSGSVPELRGSTRTIVVRVDDPAAARTALEGLVGTDALDVEADGLVVELGGATTESVVAALVTAGIGVRAVTPRGRLEDLFLELTGAGSAAAGVEATR